MGDLTSTCARPARCRERSAPTSCGSIRASTRTVCPPSSRRRPPTASPTPDTRHKRCSSITTATAIWTCSSSTTRLARSRACRSRTLEDCATRWAATGWPDIYVVDMLPEDEHRLKTTTSFEDWHRLQAEVRNGFHYQFTRNMLHLNNGNGTFSDIGQLAGVDRTDWSWSALIADLDLDGYKDIYVTNGLAKDVTSQDYIAFLANNETMRAAMRGKRVDFLKLTAAMSSTKLPHYAFRNNGDLTFSNQSAAWGLNTPSFGNGAAYGDLDGDGALDLVVNNVNQEAFVYRNNARTLLPNRYLQVQLAGEGANRFAIGAKVTLESAGRQFFQELEPTRGFQSSVDYILTFGAGLLDTIDAVKVEWPDGRVSVRKHVATNQRLTIRESEAVAAPVPSPQPLTPLFTDVTDRVKLPYVHRENDFVDFDREPLIPKLLSTEGPYLAVADVNGDGLDDLFIGGARDQPGELLIQQPDGRFVSSDRSVFEQDRVSEGLGAVFFDADGDGHPHLYVVSGGNEFSSMSPALQDRLYLNDGRGHFRKATANLPSEYISGSRVVAADYDGEGDIDPSGGGPGGPWRTRRLHRRQPGTQPALPRDGTRAGDDVREGLRGQRLRPTDRSDLQRGREPSPRDARRARQRPAVSQDSLSHVPAVRRAGGHRHLLGGGLGRCGGEAGVYVRHGAGEEQR